MIAIGLAFDVRRMVAVGLIFHVGEGIPVYAIDWAVTGETTFRSLLLHSVPAGASAWALWGRPLPGGVLVPAWLVHPSAMVVAYIVADPKLNVMLVHEPFAPTASLFPALWISWLANIALSVTCLVLAWLGLRIVWRRFG
jgi:hypothetical protein